MHARAEWVHQGLRDGNLMAVCDSSYKPLLTSTGASTGWIIESPNKEHQLQGFCCIDDMYADTYCGELLGIYTILMAVHFIEASNPDMPTSLLRIGCDN